MGEKAVILCLPAYNGIEIISMVFKSFEEGVAYVSEVLDRGPDEIKEGYACWDAYYFFNGKPRMYKEGVEVPKFKDWKEKDEWVKNNPDKLTERIPPSDGVDKIVTGYYGGCGEAGEIEVKVVEYNTPLCKFNFD